MKNNMSSGTFTNASLPYDGVTPTEINITISDYELDDGYIIISGYKFNIKNGEITGNEKVN